MGWVVLGLLVFLLLIFLMTAITMVKQGYVYTIERFGKFTKAADPGLTIIFPLIDRVGHRINMRPRPPTRFPACIPRSWRSPPPTCAP